MYSCLFVQLICRILEDFLEVMNRHSEKLCEILASRCGGEQFDIFPLVTHCALDIICETAMGRSINSQEDSDTPYVRAIYQASDIIFKRQRYQDILTPTNSLIVLCLYTDLIRILVQVSMALA